MGFVQRCRDYRDISVTATPMWITCTTSIYLDTDTSVFMLYPPAWALRLDSRKDNKVAHPPMQNEHMKAVTSHKHVLTM